MRVEIVTCDICTKETDGRVTATEVYLRWQRIPKDTDNFYGDMCWDCSQRLRAGINKLIEELKPVPEFKLNETK